MPTASSIALHLVQQEYSCEALEEISQCLLRGTLCTWTPQLQSLREHERCRSEICPALIASWYLYDKVHLMLYEFRIHCMLDCSWSEFQGTCSKLLKFRLAGNPACVANSIAIHTNYVAMQKCIGDLGISSLSTEPMSHKFFMSWPDTEPTKLLSWESLISSW